MKEEIKNLIEKYSDEGDFIGKIVNDNVIVNAVLELGVTIPKEYKWFIENYGQGGIGGVDIIGVSKLNKALFKDITLEYRKYGLLDNLIVIENCGEWSYCIDTNNEEIISWDRINGVSGVRYKTFFEFLEDRFNDEIENM